MSVDDVQDAFKRLPTLVAALQSTGRYQNAAGWSLVASQPEADQLAVTESDPYALAAAHKYLAFKSSSQFTRNARFLLVYVIHPWFNLQAHVDFAGSTSIFLRSLARRTFLEFSQSSVAAATFDRKVGNTSLTLGNVSALLSGMLFVDVWPDSKRSWLFLNPRATHRITRNHIERMFDFRKPYELSLDDFVHDDY